MPLTSAQKRYLKGLAHGLKPIVLIGQRGVSPAVLAELDAALEHHELVKVKISTGGDGARRDAVVGSLCEGTRSELVQRIGNVAILYRTPDEKPRIVLP